MTLIYAPIAFLLLMAVFFVANRSRGALFALGASIVSLVVLGAAYFALVAIAVGSM